MNGIPQHIVDELVRAAFQAGYERTEDGIFDPVILGVVADGNTYRFVWGDREL